MSENQVAAPERDGPLYKRARQIIDAVFQSPCVVETRCFSQMEEVDQLEDRIVSLLQQPNSERCGELATLFRPEILNWIARRRIENVAISEAGALVTTLVNLATTGAGAGDGRVSMPMLPYVCEACGIQQHASGICANCGRQRLRLQFNRRHSDRCGFADGHAGECYPPATVAEGEAPHVFMSMHGGDQCWHCDKPYILHVPPTEATQVAVEAARTLEGAGYLDCDHLVKVSDARLQQVAAIISKHCQSDAGEVERLCGWCKKPLARRAASCAECWDDIVESLRTQVAEAARLRAELSTTRANAIRECDCAQRVKVMQTFWDADAKQKGRAFSDKANTAGLILELLTKKEGDDGPMAE